MERFTAAKRLEQVSRTASARNSPAQRQDLHVPAIERTEILP